MVGGIVSQTVLSLDFETFSKANLKKVGTGRYTRDPSSRVLLLGYAIDNEPVDVLEISRGQQMPRRLKEALRDPDVIKSAWNAAFERQVFQNILHMPIPFEQWRCSMVMAYTLSFPGELAVVGRLLGVPEDKQKIAHGKKLLKLFCGPNKPTKKKPWDICDDLTHPTEWAEFIEYCGRDVESERYIRNKMLKWDMPEHEWELYQLDQRINEAGIPINMRMVENAIRIADTTVSARLAEMRRITGLANPNSNVQLLGWLKEQGYKFDDLKKGHVQTAINRLYEACQDDPGAYEYHRELIRVLEMRQEVSKTSVKKYVALREAVDDDGVLRNALQFAGAQRTWRWGGRRFQPQNLARPTPRLEKVLEEVAHHVETLDADTIELLHKYPMDVLSSCVRPVVQAQEGHIFVDADLNAIENRVLGWLANDQKILDVFRKGRDPYIDFGTYMFKESYEALFHEYKVEGKKDRRTLSKPAVLGCFAAETKVLTDSGWKPIVSVGSEDMLFDGVEFVRHEGLLDQGYKRTIDLAGVRVTPEHKFLVGEAWLPAERLVNDSSSFRRALSTATGQLSATLKSEIRSHTTNASAHAEGVKPCTPAACVAAVAANAIGAPLRRIVGHLASASAQVFTTKSRVVTTPFAPAAGTPKIQNMAATAAAALNADSKMRTLSSRIASMFSRVTFSAPSVSLRSTASTMTDITSQGTSGGRTGRARTAIDEIPTKCPMTAGRCSALNFIANTRADILMQARSYASCAMGNLRKRLLTSRTSAKVRTYDILNCGPRNRFVVLTDRGPVIAHNCGFMLSAGEERLNHKTGEMEGTGLIGYARNMGVNMTRDQAAHAVKVFRNTFTEVVKFWYNLERAAKACIRTGRPQRVGFIVFDMSGPFMRMKLPSGRSLHYFKPRVELKRKPWGDIGETITYEGLNDKNQWVRVPTHPGKLTENAVQAVARDLLGHAMLLCRKKKVGIRLHVHDQIVGMVKKENAELGLQILLESMKTVPQWAPGLILGAEGTIARVFMKD